MADSANTSNKVTRCINLDWLEIYCHESVDGYPHNADYFRSQGFEVIERPYGTAIYQEMFTVCDQHGEKMLEVRRNPIRAEYGKFQVMDIYSAHLRLVNRYCYYTNAADIMKQFIERYGFIYQRISRVDLALDFERFDSGDNPKKFVMRYLKKRFAKINQGNIAAHGKDEWDSITFNSIKWGAPKSMVSTKLYNKSLELREKSDKPYIRQAWCAAHLVDNLQMTKLKKDGEQYSPEIWRLEFSIKSDVKGWLVMENSDGGKNKYLSVHNNLDCYTTKAEMLKIFAGLQHHYFRFVYFDKNKTKYECEPKVLFRWEDVPVFYDIDRPLKATNEGKAIDSLIARLLKLKAETIKPEVIQACDTLLDYLHTSHVLALLPYGAKSNEVLLLQTLLGYRVNSHNADRPLSDDVQFITNMLNFEETIF